MSSPVDQVGADVHQLIGQLESALARIVHMGDPEHLAGRPDTVRAAAAAWRTIATALRDLAAEHAARGPGAWEGEAWRAFAGHRQQVTAKIDRLASECEQAAAALDDAAGRMAGLNSEIAAVVHEMRALSGLAHGLAPTGLSLALSRASGLVDRLAALVAAADAALLSMLAWLRMLELLFAHDTGQVPRLHYDIVARPALLPGGRIGALVVPRIGARPQPTIGTHGGPPGSPRDLLPMWIAAMIAAGVSLAVVLRMLQGLADGSDGGAGGPVEARRTYEQWQQWLSRGQQAFGITEATPLGTPPPPNDPRQKRDEYDEVLAQLRLRRKARQAAGDLGVDPARFERLAFDSDQGKLTENSIVEARIGVRLEQRGQLSGIVRAPGGEGEFVDASGTHWDVKTPQGLNIDSQIETIDTQFGRSRNVIINTQNLTPAEVAQLQQEVATRGWSQRVLFVAP